MMVHIKLDIFKIDLLIDNNDPLIFLLVIGRDSYYIIFKVCDSLLFVMVVYDHYYFLFRIYNHLLFLFVAISIFLLFLFVTVYDPYFLLWWSVIHIISSLYYVASYYYLIHDIRCFLLFVFTFFYLFPAISSVSFEYGGIFSVC